MTIRGVREGVVLADDLAKSAPFLIAPVGKDLTGHLRRAGVLFRLHELCVSGDLPFKSTMPKMVRANWHQLELKSGKFKAHFVRTESEFAFPEDSPSRQDERMDNQGDLFKNPKIVPISQVIEEVRELFAWLTYKLERSGGISHLCWAVPQNDADEWLAHINILNSASGSLPIPALDAPVTPDPRASMRFREHVTEVLKDRDTESSNGSSQ